MTEKLTIVINGLEYVAKEEKPEFTVEELLNRISELVIANDGLTGEVQAMSMIINDLEQEIAELHEEAELNLCKFSELDEALNDIYQVAKQFA